MAWRGYIALWILSPYFLYPRCCDPPRFGPLEAARPCCCFRGYRIGPNCLREPPTYIHAPSWDIWQLGVSCSEPSSFRVVGELESTMSSSCSCKGFVELSLFVETDIPECGSAILPGGLRIIFAAPNGAGPRAIRFIGAAPAPGREVVDLDPGRGAALMKVCMVIVEFMVELSWSWSWSLSPSPYVPGLKGRAHERQRIDPAKSPESEAIVSRSARRWISLLSNLVVSCSLSFLIMLSIT